MNLSANRCKGIQIDCDVNADRNFLRLEQSMCSAGISAGESGNEVKEIDGVLLWLGAVERTQNSMVTHKSTI